MILKRYAVVEEGFWEYRIFDNEIEGELDDYGFEDKEYALKAYKELNRQLCKKSVYKQNEIIAKAMKVADKIKICIQPANIESYLCFEIDKNALILDNFISNCRNFELYEIEIDSKNVIKEIIIREA